MYNNNEKKGLFIAKMTKVMKKIKIIVVSVLFCAMGYTGYTAREKMTMSEVDNFMKSNVEALTSDEPGGDGSGWVYCRCHDDQHCYVGNAVSFRPACVRLYGATNCDDYRYHCPPAGV